MRCRGSSERARVHRPPLGPRAPDPRERRPRPAGCRSRCRAAHGCATRPPRWPSCSRGSSAGVAEVDAARAQAARPRRRDPVPRRHAAARAGAGAPARAPHGRRAAGAGRTTRRRSSAGCAAPPARRSRPAPTAPRRRSASRSTRVTIRDPRTRWGSCSSSGSLSFSWRLVLAPEEVLDYVVWHEVCHLREMNHSPRYWALVARHCPGYEGAAALAAAQRHGAARRAQ